MLTLSPFPSSVVYHHHRLRVSSALGLVPIALADDPLPAQSGRGSHDHLPSANRRLGQAGRKLAACVSGSWALIWDAILMSYNVAEAKSWGWIIAVVIIVVLSTPPLFGNEVCPLPRAATVAWLTSSTIMPDCARRRRSRVGSRRGLWHRAPRHAPRRGVQLLVRLHPLLIRGTLMPCGQPLPILLPRIRDKAEAQVIPLCVSCACAGERGVLDVLGVPAERVADVSERVLATTARADLHHFGR